MITRFAPSMTGYLHLGHIYHLLYLNAIARYLNLIIKLRIEDHDKQRSKSDYEEALFYNLNSLGISWNGDPLYQSSSLSYYDKCLKSLEEKNLVYGCNCSRSKILSTQEKKHKEILYNGACRNKGLPLNGNAVRIRVSNHHIKFKDSLMGEFVQNPKLQCGDFTLRDRNGNYTYQFACVCDDIRQNVTHIIRGSDILESTGRQIYLYNQLEDNPPLYFHHSLKKDDNGIKLSKRNKSMSINKMLNNGVLPENIFAMSLDISGSLSFNNAIDYLLEAEIINSLSAQSA